MVDGEQSEKDKTPMGHMLHLFAHLLEKLCCLSTSIEHSIAQLLLIYLFVGVSSSVHSGRAG